MPSTLYILVLITSGSYDSRPRSPARTFGVYACVESVRSSHTPASKSQKQATCFNYPAAPEHPGL